MSSKLKESNVPHVKKGKKSESSKITTTLEKIVENNKQKTKISKKRASWHRVSWQSTRDRKKSKLSKRESFLDTALFNLPNFPPLIVHNEQVEETVPFIQNSKDEGYFDMELFDPLNNVLDDQQLELHMENAETFLDLYSKNNATSEMTNELTTPGKYDDQRQTTNIASPTKEDERPWSYDTTILGYEEELSPEPVQVLLNFEAEKNAMIPESIKSPFKEENPQTKIEIETQIETMSVMDADMQDFLDLYLKKNASSELTNKPIFYDEVSEQKRMMIVTPSREEESFRSDDTTMLKYIEEPNTEPVKTNLQLQFGSDVESNSKAEKDIQLQISPESITSAVSCSSLDVVVDISKNAPPGSNRNLAAAWQILQNPSNAENPMALRSYIDKIGLTCASELDYLDDEDISILKSFLKKIKKITFSLHMA